ncbi:MarR family winged helix-turn-helix transcriptional regulator [Spirochaeta cellobiosiphila]|uniref:MarR family winged helix-turn-helix transcriptional regulator n=1 Tax=Spirochaeta cellobiosiphila TaxID=504483 RepID=UPI0003FDD6DB|nr:MarR family transcriptional regulator [Spirochaeta cellobiosiphila]
MDTSEQILTTLRQIIRAIDLHSKTLAKKYGLTGPQLLVLKEFYKSPEQTVGKVAANVSLSQATVTSILDRLEKQKFVSRIRSSEDKRKVNIKLEEKSIEILKTNPGLLQEDFTTQFERLSDWEQGMLISSLQRIAAMMNADKIASQPVLMSGPISASSREISAYLED